MWVKTENSEAKIPAAIETSGNYVILRRRFELVGATEDKPEHYEYEEWQMTEDQYKIYQQMEQQIAEQSESQKAITDYNIMMGNLEDPAEEEEESEG